MSEHDQQFNSFEEWVGKASSWLTRRGKNIHAICYDTSGRIINDGAGFMRARDEDCFPVKWIWSDQSIFSAKRTADKGILCDWWACPAMNVDTHGRVQNEGTPCSNYNWAAGSESPCTGGKTP